MKKHLFLISALAMSLTAGAASYEGIVTVNGVKQAETATLTIEGSDNNYTVTLSGVAALGEVKAYNGEGNDNFIGFDGGYSVNGTTCYGKFNVRKMRKYVVLECESSYGSDVKFTFSNVGNAFQLPNSDFETWTASSGEAQHWHGFKSATGSLARMASSKLEKSDDVRSGSTGHSALITSNVILGITANGTMTNGRLKAESSTASSTDNHSEMDAASTDMDNDGNPFYMACPARPDAIKAWMKFNQEAPNSSYPYATISAVIFDSSSGQTYYQDPEDKAYTNVVAKAQNPYITTGDWREVVTPFSYEATTSANPSADAILVTISTNAAPGQGSKSTPFSKKYDRVWVDDLELVYDAGLSNIKYKGADIEIDPSTNSVVGGALLAPKAEDFTFETTGADSNSGVVVAEVNFDTSSYYRVYVYSISADLAKCDYKIYYFDKYPSLAEVLPAAVEGAEVKVRDLYVASNMDDKVYVTDGDNNWVALEVADEDLKIQLREDTKIAGVAGTITGVNTNPVIAVNSLTVYPESTSGIAFDVIDLKHHFVAKPNGVYFVDGYIDANGKLRAYSGESGEMGQSLTIDKKYIPEQTFNAGMYVKTISVFTINEAWTESAPSKVASNAERYFDNYTILPINVDDSIFTAIDDVENATVESVRYYNLQGVEVNGLQNGVNIVVKTLSNGKTQVEKVIK